MIRQQEERLKNDTENNNDEHPDNMNGTTDQIFSKLSLTLAAAQLSLVLQDALMLGCATVITAYLWHHDYIRASNSWLSPLLQAVIVSLGVMSNLAAQARVIAVERDWIVEICGMNSDRLACE